MQDITNTVASNGLIIDNTQGTAALQGWLLEPDKTRISASPQQISWDLSCQWTKNAESLRTLPPLGATALQVLGAAICAWVPRPTVVGTISPIVQRDFATAKLTEASFEGGFGGTNLNLRFVIDLNSGQGDNPVVTDGQCTITCQEFQDNVENHPYFAVALAATSVSVTLTRAFFKNINGEDFEFVFNQYWGENASKVEFTFANFVQLCRTNSDAVVYKAIENALSSVPAGNANVEFFKLWRQGVSSYINYNWVCTSNFKAKPSLLATLRLGTVPPQVFLPQPALDLLCGRVQRG